jgi:hypothetical protein
VNALSALENLRTFVRMQAELAAFAFNELGQKISSSLLFSHTSVPLDTYRIDSKWGQGPEFVLWPSKFELFQGIKPQN